MMLHTGYTVEQFSVYWRKKTTVIALVDHKLINIPVNQSNLKLWYLGVFCHFRYVRALGAMYMRLVGTSMDCYNYLEPLYNDYRKIRRKNKMGSKLFNPYLSNYLHRKVFSRCTVLWYPLFEVYVNQIT